MRLFLAVGALAFIACLACAQAADVLSQVDVLVPVWRHTIAPGTETRLDVAGIWVHESDLGTGGKTGIVTSGFTTSAMRDRINRLHIILEDGTYDARLGINDHIRFARSHDLNNDGRMEYIISSGEILNNIHRGTVRVVSPEARVLRSFSSNIIYNTFEVVDLNSDRHYEIVGGSSNRIFLFDSYGDRKWQYPPMGGELFRKSTDSIAFLDFNRDGVMDIVTASDQIYVFDAKVRVLAGSYDPQPEVPQHLRGYKRIFAIEGGIRRTGAIIALTDTNTMYKVEIREIQDDPERGFKIRPRDWNITWELELPCDALEVESANLDLDQHMEYLVSCKENMVLAVDDNGVVVWEYLLDGVPNGFHIVDMTDDKNEDILIATSSGSIYLLSRAGEYIWRYFAGSPLIAIAAGDAGPRGSKQVVVVTEDGDAVGYKINEDYNLEREAQRLFVLGQRQFISSDYENSKKNLEGARRAYMQLENGRMIIEVDNLLKRIEEILRGRDQDNADIFFAKAREYYFARDYDNAKVHATRAKNIYERYSDRDGVLRCELLILEIEKAQEVYAIPTTLHIDAGDVGQHSQEYGFRMIYLVIGALIIAGSLGIYFMVNRGRKPKPRTIGDLTEDVGDEVLDETNISEDAKDAME
jgi:hypothetical protein